MIPVHNTVFLKGEYQKTFPIIFNFASLTNYMFFFYQRSVLQALCCGVFPHFNSFHLTFLKLSLDSLFLLLPFDSSIHFIILTHIIVLLCFSAIPFQDKTKLFPL